MVVGEIFWKPFEVRFKDNLAQMGRHRSLIELEISLLGAQASANLLLAASEENKIAEIERDMAAEARASAAETAETTREIRHMVENQRAGRIIAIFWICNPY